MDEQARHRAFEPFFTTKGAEGIGLGLSTSFRILAELGGSIEIESALGEGTRIEIFLPLDADDLHV